MYYKTKTNKQTNKAVVWMFSIFLISDSLQALFQTFRGLFQVQPTVTLILDSFLFLKQGPSVCLSFCFLLFPPCGLPEQQNPPDSRFFFS